MKTIKVNHVVLTLALNSAALANGGETQESLDGKINARLAQGYDEVEVIPLRTNFDERQQPTHVVNQYIFRKFESVVVVEKEPSKAKTKVDA